MEVDAGDGAVSQGKMLPAKGLKTLVVLHVPHANILGVGISGEVKSGFSGVQLARGLGALLGAQPLR